MNNLFLFIQNLSFGSTIFPFVGQTLLLWSAEISGALVWRNEKEKTKNQHGMTKVF